MLRSLKLLWLGIAIGLACVPAMSMRVHACTLCLGFPEKTAVDYLLESDCVVLAREDKDQPYSYCPHTTLKGNPAGEPIDLLLDSATRRLLQVEPDRNVVLVRDSRSRQWRSLGIATRPYEDLIRRLVVISETWRGAPGADRRWEFFLPRFGDQDPSIRQLAYLEMGRAPYHAIRQLGRVADRDDYIPMLTDPKYLEWRSLAILLLAQSDSPQDQQLVRDSFHAASRFGMTMNLAAWAAAVIEVDGESAIRMIEEEHFQRSGKSSEALPEILRALSMQGSDGGTELQDRIVYSYRLLIENSPQLAGQVAEDMSRWKRPDLIKELIVILESDTFLPNADAQSVRRYVDSASTWRERGRVHD